MAAAPDPYEILRSTKEKENFQRVTRLLISGGTTLLGEIFDQLCPPSNLPIVLKNPATEKRLRSAKLTKPQWDCLYPSPGVYGKSTDFDVTLLFKLLRTICNLIPPATGWDALPTSADHSLAADLARIKYYRNTVYGHVIQNMEIVDDEFPQLWQDISEALLRIAGQISPAKKTAWQETMDNLLTDPLTAEDERNVQELLSWYSTDVEVKKYIETLREDLKVVREEAQDIKDHFAEELKSTSDDIQNFVREEVQGIKDYLGGEQKITAQEVQRLKRELKSTSQEVQCLKKVFQFQSLTGYQNSAGLSLQVGASEVMRLKEIEDATGVSSIRYESEVGRNEILLKYGEAKTLQGELGNQLRSLWDILKHFTASYNELVTKHNEFKHKHITAVLVGNSVSLVGQIANFFSFGVGLPFVLVGTVIYVAKSLHLLCSANKTEPQLFTELQLTVGQFKEAVSVCRSQHYSFIQCLECIVELCHKYPNELVVLRECGQVSTKDIGRDISLFRSKLDDFIRSVAYSKGIHMEGMPDEEEAMSHNILDVSALDEDEKVMKLIRLTKAPIILTKGTAIQ